ncbi:MAG TPA: phosphatidate cytidylyltransferase [Spirochaetota bacterium]|nr:phosphatidate cytidylyltransferase [Spirochaetota bacterium]
MNIFDFQKEINFIHNLLLPKDDKKETTLFSNFMNISFMLKKELFRKTIHMLSSFIPFFYFFSQSATMVFLLFISFVYFMSEVLRFKKIRIPVIIKITELASRSRDEGKIVLGPITLSLGIFLALTFFDYRVAVISVFALSFGDGVASLFGKIIGGPKIPFTFGKTFSGTLGCFLVLTIVFFNCGLQFTQAIFLAFFASTVEAFPTGDFDNLIIPVATGIMAQNLII